MKKGVRLMAPLLALVLLIILSGCGFTPSPHEHQIWYSNANSYTYGCPGGGYMEVSAYFGPGWLNAYAPGSLVGLRVYIGSTSYHTITVKVYSSGGYEIRSQDATIVPNSWNTIYLASPAPITLGTELWAGYVAWNAFGEQPCGAGLPAYSDANWYRYYSSLPPSGSWSLMTAISWNIVAIISSTRGPDRAELPAESGPPAGPPTAPAGASVAQ